MSDMRSLITATTVWGQRGQIAVVLIVWLALMFTLTRLLARWLDRRAEQRHQREAHDRMRRSVDVLNRPPARPRWTHRT